MSFFEGPGENPVDPGDFILNSNMILQLSIILYNFNSGILIVNYTEVFSTYRGIPGTNK